MTENLLGVSSLVLSLVSILLAVWFASSAKKDASRAQLILDQVLLSAPKAVDYYPKVGFTKHESAWVLRKGDPLMEDHRGLGAEGAV
jgi:hypothetical protein